MEEEALTKEWAAEKVQWRRLLCVEKHLRHGLLPPGHGRAIGISGKKPLFFT